MKYSYYFWSETPFPWSNCTGSNKKHTLVLSSDDEMGGNLPFLKKILRAVDLDFDEDVHFASAPIHLKTQLLSDSQLSMYQKIILFGLSPSRVGIWNADSPGCHVFHFEKLVCISAPGLKEIESQPEHKKVLWSALKQVFQNQA